MNSEPYFYIDTATREGMSGAPVIVHAIGIYQTKQGGTRAIGTPVSHLVGVYSARVPPTDQDVLAQLGKVWHRSVIDEIITAGVPGSYKILSP